MLTGNSHAFDNGTAAGNFLYQMIQMDLFAKSGIRVYYAGDLDPEGILIAQKYHSIIRENFITGIWKRRIMRSAGQRK